MNTDDKIYRQLHDWLLNHIQSFGPPDDATRRHFDQKYIHSLRVADEITTIGRALGLRH